MKLLAKNGIPFDLVPKHLIWIPPYPICKILFLSGSATMTPYSAWKINPIKKYWIAVCKKWALPLKCRLGASSNFRLRITKQFGILTRVRIYTVLEWPSLAVFELIDRNLIDFHDQSRVWGLKRSYLLYRIVGG